MRLDIDVHHEQLMEAERLKDLLSWQIIKADDELDEELLAARLHNVIHYGMKALEEIELIIANN